MTERWIIVLALLSGPIMLLALWLIVDVMGISIFWAYGVWLAWVAGAMGLKYIRG